MPVNPVPEGHAAVTPYLIVKDAARAIDFYVKGFGATEIMRLAADDGSIAHAEVRIGDGPVMLAEENLAWGARSPETVGGTPVSLMFYVPDVDKVFAQAISAGATVKRPVEDQFYGDRAGTLIDPSGHIWTIASHVEDVSMEEISRRFETFMKEMGG